MYDLDVSKPDKVGDFLFEKKLRQDIRLEAKRKGMAISTFVRMSVLQYIEDNPLKDLPPAPPEAALTHLPEISPDAIVYKVPYNDGKVVASRRDGGWKGVVYHPEKPGSLAVWDSENHNLPIWARTNHFVRAFNFIASRIEVDGVTHFAMDNGTFITAQWDGHHFTGGDVVDRFSRRQPWQRSGAFSIMDQGPFSTLKNVRVLLNMLCQAFRAGDKPSDGTLP